MEIIDYSGQLQTLIDNQYSLIETIQKLDTITTALVELTNMMYMFLVVGGSILICCLMYKFLKKFI